MPSLVTHLLIPPLLLLATRRIPLVPVLALLPLTVVADVDFFIPPHRAFLHSVFLPLGLAALAWHWRRTGRAEHATWALVAAFYIGSHPFMDLFAGGVVPLWPLSDQTFYLDVAIFIDTRTLEPTPVFEPGSQAGVPQVTPRFQFLTGTEFAILTLTLLVAGAAAVRRARRVRQEVVVVADEAAPRG